MTWIEMVVAGAYLIGVGQGMFIAWLLTRRDGR